MGKCCDIVTSSISYEDFLRMPADDSANAEDCMAIKVSDMNLPGNERQLITATLMKRIPNDIARRKLVPPNTVVFPKRGAAIATNKKRLTTAWTVLDPNLIGVRGKNGVETEFLFYWSQFFDLRTITSPGPTPQLNKRDLAPVLIPLPDKTEQVAIAAVLRDTTDLLETLDELIEKKRKLKQGAMQELLTGRKRLPGFPTKRRTREIKTSTHGGVIPQDWNVKKLEELCVEGGLVRGPFGGSLRKEFFVENGVKVYEQKNAIHRDVHLGTYFIDTKKYDELRRFEVFPGDFIVSCSGTIGRIFQIPKNAPKGIINQALLKIRINDATVSDQYFFHHFSWEVFQAKITDSIQGGAMKNLVGMNVFRTVLISIPSTKEEQVAIAQVLSGMDSEIECLEEMRDKYLMIKKGMMQQLLTGSIRLR